MTRIVMPAEPDVDRLWTRDGNGRLLAWRRDQPPLGCVLWQRTGLDVELTWREIRQKYDEVFTSHPALGDLPPFPWLQNDDDTEEIIGADGTSVAYLTSQPRLAAFLVEAANAHAARLAGEQEK